MDRVSWLMREHPIGAAAGIFLLAAFPIVLLIAFLMSRAGVAIRPFVFFFGFLGIIAGPQIAVHLLDAAAARRTGASGAEDGDGAADGARAQVTASAGRLLPVPWTAVFGPETDPDLITDARHGLAQILGEAEDARIAFMRSGASALAARFPSMEAASRALNQYGSFFALAGAEGSDRAGWTARRHGGIGEWVHVVAAGDELYAWTAESREAVLGHRVRALGPVETQGRPVAAAGSLRGRIAGNRPFMITFAVLNVLGAALWFFRGSSWAARADALPGCPAADAAAVRSRLLALDSGEAPIAVAEAPDGRTIQLDWRHADARWFDLARLNGMKRAHRLVIQLDEATRKARVREYWSELHASAGAGGANLDWKASTGIQFYAFEHRRIFGAQIGKNGRPTGELSRSVNFNLQDIKAPAVQAVTGAGWTWQPVAWNSPRWLSWLTG